VLQVTRTANQVDVFVGQRMRRRREALGISQGRLGRHLGLTFSQVQKYEKGANRIGAGRLYQIAGFLAVPPGYFFAGLDDPEDPTDAGDDVRRKDEATILNDAFEAIRDPETRASILALVMSLSAGTAARASRG
jgi:transcriptional regulator with XRE-family HTH domain